VRTEIRESHSPRYVVTPDITSVEPTQAATARQQQKGTKNIANMKHSAARKIIKYVLHDIVRNKIVLAYTAFLLIVSVSMFYLGGGGAKGLLSLLNIMLIVVPLVSVVFSTIHFYNSYEFIELLVAQPIPRKQIFISQYVGLAGALSAALLVGVGIPVALFDSSILGFTMVGAGIGLTLIFVALALLASVFTRDKAKGIGFSLMLWFFFSLIYDGLILLLIFTLSDYPLEKFMWIFTVFNPVDLARIAILLNMDVAALMGFTGAVYKTFFGSGWGFVFSVVVMSVWVAVPLWWGLRIFKNKDL
jgi:Cu-processing system permease protein